MSSDGAAAATADVDGHYRPSSSKHAGSKTPPTPPGSPIDRPFPAATLPPPGGKTVLQMIREEGDGCRRGKSSSRTAKKSASHHSTNADLPPRQPSDGYQVLDEVQGEPSAGTSSSLDHRSRHQHHNDQQQQQQQQPGVSSTSGSEDSSSEFDWSEDDAAVDSSDEHSDDQVDRPARAAADGMSSDAESECLL